MHLNFNFTFLNSIKKIPTLAFSIDIPNEVEDHVLFFQELSTHIVDEISLISQTARTLEANFDNISAEIYPVSDLEKSHIYSAEDENTIFLSENDFAANILKALVYSDEYKLINEIASSTTNRELHIASLSKLLMEQHTTEIETSNYVTSLILSDIEDPKELSEFQKEPWEMDIYSDGTSAVLSFSNSHTARDIDVSIKISHGCVVLSTKPDYINAPLAEVRIAEDEAQVFANSAFDTHSFFVDEEEIEIIDGDNDNLLTQDWTDKETDDSNDEE